MAYARRYAARPHRPRTGPLEANEINEAKLEIIRAVQKEAFPNEFKILKEGNLRLQESSKLQGLRPYYDEVDRVIRLRRRTRLSKEEAVDLIVLPSKHWLLNLLIWDAHKRVKHAGVSQTITEIRQSYWILRGRQAVRDLQSKCVPCRKLYGRCLNQPIAPLPSKRCSRSLAFETVGIDFAGPLFIKKTDRTTSKAYICLITCAATRAIHLEIVCSLTTDDFLLAFRRFIAQRGLCRIVYSDNAKTFQKADTVLLQLWENLESAEVRAFFANTGIEWRFICERAPWWGGFYESMVKSVKMPLKKILGRALLSHDEMETTLKEIEAAINSRPLTYEYNELREPEPITPSHFIIGRRLNLLPPLTLEPVEEEELTAEQLTNRVRYRERLLDSYWQKWRGEYFHQLSNRPDNNPASQQNIRPGTVVVIKEDGTPRHKWKMGVIRKVFKGPDRIVRAARVLTENGFPQRPVQKLFPLEVYSEPEEPNPAQQDQEESSSDDEEPPAPDQEEEPEDVAPPDPESATSGEDVRTRSGRVIRIPRNLRDYVMLIN